MRQESHDLQYLEVLFDRNGLTSEEVKEYQKLSKGYQGEVEFDKLCQYFLNEEMSILDDITLFWNKNVTQIDKIIASEKVIYIIDIKNYYGNYRYENHCWTVNENILSNNIYEQLLRTVHITQQLFSQNGVKKTVKGVLAFINPSPQIEIVDTVDVLTLSSMQISQWLMTLQVEFGSSLWQDVIKNYHIPSFFKFSCFFKPFYIK